MHDSRRPGRHGHAALLVFVLAAGAIGAGAWQSAALQDREILNLRYNELAAIGQLKVAEIAGWREERLADARALAESELLASVVEQWLRTPGEPQPRSLLERHLASNRVGDRDVLIVLPDATPLIGQPPRPALEATTTTLVRRAAERREAIFGDFYWCTRCQEVRLDVAAPICDTSGRPIGVLLERLDPSRTIYPLLKSWPTPSATAETLLVRRDGDEVLFLNELRHRSGAPLNMRQPVVSSTLPAARAVAGQVGRHVGRDYREREVLTDLRPVPGTPWFMVAKVDLDEALADARARNRLVLMLAILGILFTAALLGYLTRRHQRDVYRSLLDAELERKALTRHYEYVVRYAHDLLVLADQDGLILEANRRALDEYGYEAAEIRGLPLRDLDTSPGDGREVSREDPAGAGVTYETIRRRKDGTVFPAEVSARVIDVEGRRFYHEIVRNISERKQAEAALRESEERFRATLYSIGDGVITTDTDGLVTRMNRPAEALTGWVEEQAAGQPIDRVFHIVNEETRREVANPVRRVLETGLVFGLANHTVLVARDGVERPIADSGAPIRAADGATQGVVLVFQDQTEQRRIQAHDRWLSSMLEQSVNEVYVFDAATLRFAYVNGTALAHLGYTFDEMRDMTPLDIKPELSPARFESLIAPVRSAAQPTIEFETVHRTKSGELYDVLILLRLIEAPWGPQFLAMGLDITNRRRLELQLLQAQRMEAVGRLAGGIAHDFNNLLGVINNYADFGLQRGDPYSCDYFGEIRTAGQRAAVLTRQLLAFSRKQVLQPEILSLNDVVADVEGMLRPLIGEDVNLSIALGADSCKVRADRSQIEQVLVNLAANAKDAMPDGGDLRLETSTVLLEDEHAATPHVAVSPGSYVLLSVSDSGHGMDEETRRRAFEPFFTTKAVGKGAGLGLSMVYGIVKQSGGYIFIDSQPGLGATFRIYLPALDEPAMPRPASAVVRRSGGTERVLVVEDEPSVRRLTCRILESAGYQVFAAADPLDALELGAARREPIHLLVTDVVMPKMSGSQLANRLLTLWPSLRVLYMSGYMEDAIVHHGVLEPGTEFIAKPFTASELTRKVREVIDRDSPAATAPDGVEAGAPSEPAGDPDANGQG